MEVVGAASPRSLFANGSFKVLAKKAIAVISTIPKACIQMMWVVHLQGEVIMVNNYLLNKV